MRARTKCSDHSGEQFKRAALLPGEGKSDSKLSWSGLWSSWSFGRLKKSFPNLTKPDFETGSAKCSFLESSREPLPLFRCQVCLPLPSVVRL
jgi:hypothetical protein